MKYLVRNARTLIRGYRQIIEGQLRNGRFGTMNSIMAHFDGWVAMARNRNITLQLVYDDPHPTLKCVGLMIEDTIGDRLRVYDASVVLNTEGSFEIFVIGEDNYVKTSIIKVKAN